MSKIHIWIDSGANIHSRNDDVVDLENDLGITLDEWEECSEEEKWETVSQWFTGFGWGYNTAE